MPTYEYLCEKCGHTFEKFQSMLDAPLKTCPQDLCARKRWGKGPVKRVIGAGAGLIFKGSGFYITDYRSEGYQAAARKESASPSASGSGNGKSASDSGTGAGGTTKLAEKSKPATTKSD